MIVDSDIIIVPPISAEKARELMHQEYVPTKNDVIVLARLLNEIDKEIEKAASANRGYLKFQFNCIYAETVGITSSSVEYIVNRTKQILTDENYIVVGEEKTNFIFAGGKIVGFCMNCCITWDWEE